MSDPAKLVYPKGIVDLKTKSVGAKIVSIPGIGSLNQLMLFEAGGLCKRIRRKGRAGLC